MYCTIVFVCIELIEVVALPKRRINRLSTFDETTRLYGRLLRWGEYEGAVNLIRHQDESNVEIRYGLVIKSYTSQIMILRKL